MYILQFLLQIREFSLDRSLYDVVNFFPSPKYLLCIVARFLKFRLKCFVNSASFRKQILWKAKLLLSCLLCLEVLPYFYLFLLILLSGDIEVNPGPNRNGFLKFCHWNLNSICAREQIKISLIEAYNSIHRYDIFAISETMLNDTVHNDDILIEGFSREIFRSDHADNLRSGGVCIYYRDGLSIKRRTDLESLNEMVCAEVTVARKRFYFLLSTVAQARVSINLKCSFLGYKL